MPGPPPPVTDDGGLQARWKRVVPLVRVLGLRELRTRYRQSALDALWTLINPMVVMVVYGVVLHSAFKADGEGIPYLTFSWTGLVLWTFVSTGLGQAMPSLVASGDLVTKVYFPREAIPLSLIAATVADLGIGLVTVVVVAALQHVYPTIHAVAVVVPLLVLVVWVAAIAVLASVLTVFIRDVNHAGQLLLRVGFFATPVMYAPTALPHWLHWTATVNPVSVCIEGVRTALLRDRWPDWALLGAHGSLAVVLFVAGLAYTRAVESRIPDVV